VRQFIFDDIPLYHNCEFVRKPGEPPFLHLLNESGERVESVDLSPLNRQQCNEELTKRGFYRKQSVDEPVPSEFKDAPLSQHSKEEL
jgi:hypothetical protein